MRATALARRERLGGLKRAEASKVIAERVMAIVAAEKPGIVAAYLPIRSECDARPIIEKARRLGIAIVLPAVTDPVTVVFRRFEPGAPLAAGGFGTLAPPPDQPILDPELVIVPVVAFDRAGIATRPRTRLLRPGGDGAEGSRRRPETRRHRFCDAGGRADPERGP